MEPRGPKLLDCVRNALRTRHYSRRTEEAYLLWIRRFIVFHGKRHPRELGEAEVSAFISSLAMRGVSASTQNQALSAVLFLFEVVIGRKLPWMTDIIRAQRPSRLPVVLSREEVTVLLGRLRGTVWLMASLMYGAGLRLQECVELRIKDVCLDRSEVTVRDGKGGKDRVTMLPAALRAPLAEHLARAKAQHDADLEAGRGGRAARGTRGEVSECRARMGVAVGFSGHPVLRRPDDRGTATAPLARDGGAAARQRRRAGGRPGTSGNMPFAASFVRHASARRRLRHTDDSGAAGAS